MARIAVKMLDNEYWWGGSVNLGYLMPFDKDSVCTVDPNAGPGTDQMAPLFLSSKGRYIRSEKPFVLKAENGMLLCEGPDEIVLEEGKENLRGAYLASMQKHFPFDGRMPDTRFYEFPQYNTWIEMKTEQTTDNILRYARGIVEHGLPAGILMIDEGWAEGYGVFAFNKNKIPDPAYLISELHRLGFAVMLWVTPAVDAAGVTFRALEKKGWLVKDCNGQTAIRRWWNGYSAVLDLTNPEVEEWYHEQLHGLMNTYSVDGFKFDAGDCCFYRDDDQCFLPVLAREQATVFNRIGEKYSLNEFRAAWNFGGRPIVARLHDKMHAWKGLGLDTLIPHTVVQGLLGYAFGCPDMVGGGEAGCFGQGSALDEELFIRWAQANAYMGMMQVSIAPWRVLSEKSAKKVIDAISAHARMGKELLGIAQESAISGEPLVRNMAYQFPDEKLEKVNTQFMLGSRLLVAPVLEKGAISKTVYLPSGMWEGFDGKRYEGPSKLEVPVSIDEIAWFQMIG